MGLQCESTAPVRYAIVWRHLSCSPSCHRLLFGSSIAQNHRVNNLTALHTALCGKFRLADAEE